MSRNRVLILCTGNSARSQMAEGILRHDGGEHFEVASAGVNPGSVRPEAIAVMGEIGIDISGHWSKSIADLGDQEFDIVITVCDHAREVCPVLPGNAEKIHRSFEDPPSAEAAGILGAEKTTAIFRRVRDEIRAWMKQFITEKISNTGNHTEEQI